METNKETPKEEFAEGIQLKATLRTDEELTPTPGCRFTSGSTLRREYIYKKRDEYIAEHQQIPSKELMDSYALAAKKIYMEEGDYKVVGEEATWLGKY